MSAASGGNEANKSASSTDILKLTAYFAERERAGGKFLAEALLDLFADRGVATSVMLRGIASFGPRNIVRSDESLSMSEDPPVTLSATDRPEVITALVDDVTALTGRGLITLERGRLASGAAAGAGNEATRMTVYLGRRQRAAGAPAYRTVTEVFHRLGFAGATVFLGVDGTVNGERRRAGFLSHNPDVPMFAVGVGTPDQAAAAGQELSRLLPDHLLTVERTRVVKRDGTVLADLHELPTTDPDGLTLFQKLTVYTFEDSRHDGHPIHRQLVRRLRESQHAAGATVLRGLWGYHGDHRPKGDRLLHIGRRVPVSTVIIDTPENIVRSFAIVDELTGRHGLVTSEIVPAMIALDGDYRNGGTRLANPPG